MSVIPEGTEGPVSAPPWADLPAYRAAFRAGHPVPAPERVVPMLAERRQWLLWRYEPGETPEKKPRKMPYYAGGARRTGGQGTDRDRALLATFEAVAAAAGKGDFDGVGFAFLPGDGLIGIDLDGMIDPGSGEISERCRQIIDACASYTELSPSGKGVHIICAGETETFKSNVVGVEVFCGRQYFTFTADVWEGAPLAVRPIDEAVLRRLRATVRGAKKPKGAGPGDAPAPSAPSAPSGRPAGRERSLAETVAQVEEALGHVDPDEYEQWIEVGMACKAGLGTAGYYVWDAWSSKSQKYAGPDDTRKRWDGFHPQKVTLGTVFGLAESAGWVSPWARAKTRPRKRKAEPSGPAADPAEGVSTATRATAEEGPEAPPEDDWPRMLIRKKGDVSACLANAELLLSKMRVWVGVIAYDEFAEKTVFRQRPPFMSGGPETGEWTDHHDVMTAIWLQRQWQVEFSPATVGQAVEALSRSNRFHPVREALEGLAPWDGVRRNHAWLADFLGAPQTEYTARVGTFFLRGMIKRVMSPGCKFDFALVLEGDQGKGKSTVARTLAWDWFADTDLDLSNKDALMALPGHWVYEIAEMGSLMKAEERKQKSFLSRQEDEYRPPYGKRLIKVPRQSVFIGTTNEDEYLKDATGGRRFWPVRVEEVNLDGLRSALPQMFAEALADHREGKRCYPTADEQRDFFDPEQEKRGMPEPFEEMLWNWVSKRDAPFSMADAAMDCLKLTPDKLTQAIVTRLGTTFTRKLGCVRKEDRLADPDRRRLYVPRHLRALAGLSAPAGAAVSEDGGIRAPF